MQETNPLPQSTNTSAPPANQPNPRRNLITLIFIIVGGIIGFLVGGSVYEYAGTKGYDWGWGAVSLLIYPPVIFAILAVFAYNSVKSLNKFSKILGWLIFCLFTLSIAVSIFVLVLLEKEREAYKSSIPSRVDFRVYKPGHTNPFKNFSEDLAVSKDEVERKCRNVKYVYFGKELEPEIHTAFIIQIQADAYNCPSNPDYLDDTIYREEYDEALKAAQFDSLFKFRHKVVPKNVNGETILIVRVVSKEDGTQRFSSLLATKGNTLIKIYGGSCFTESDCEQVEQVFIDLYKSLQ